MSLGIPSLGQPEVRSPLSAQGWAGDGDTSKDMHALPASRLLCCQEGTDTERTGPNHSTIPPSLPEGVTAPGCRWPPSVLLPHRTPGEARLAAEQPTCPAAQKRSFRWETPDPISTTTQFSCRKNHAVSGRAAENFWRHVTGGNNHKQHTALTPKHNKTSRKPPPGPAQGLECSQEQVPGPRVAEGGGSSACDTADRHGTDPATLPAPWAQPPAHTGPLLGSGCEGSHPQSHCTRARCTGSWRGLWAWAGE